jgi:hypothetical protein
MKDADLRQVFLDISSHLGRVESDLREWQESIEHKIVPTNAELKVSEAGAGPPRAEAMNRFFREVDDDAHRNRLGLIFRSGSRCTLTRQRQRRVGRLCCR